MPLSLIKRICGFESESSCEEGVCFNFCCPETISREYFGEQTFHYDLIFLEFKSFFLNKNIITLNKYNFLE